MAEADLRRTTERLLSHVFAGARTTESDVLDTVDGEPSVVRFGLSGPSSVPGSVICKRAVSAEHNVQLFNDWAALSFIGPPLAPQLYAGDHTEAVVLMEDLGDGPSLADVLQGGDAAAAHVALVAFARALGRLHASTAGRRDEYEALRSALDDRTGDRWFDDPRHVVDGFADACSGFEVRPGDPAQRRIADALAAMREPGVFDAYTHLDPCPDNTRLGQGRVRLFDFAFGGFGHALLDGTFGRVPFPTCWCLNRLPSHLPEAMEEVYRSELATTVPAAADGTAYESATTDAWIAWLVWTTSWRVREVLRQDEEWGIATRRQRLVLRWELFAAEAERRAPELAPLADALVRRFGELWPDLPSVPLYPAFRDEPQDAAG